MRRSLRLALILGATFGASLASAAPAGAVDVILQGATGEGVILHPDAAGVVGAHKDDKLLGAKGHIGRPEPGCPGHFHYHGTLFNKPDPAPQMCGWGPVFALGNASDAYKHTAEAIAAETSAVRRKSAKGALEDLAGVDKSTDQMIEDLNRLIRTGRIGGGKAKDLFPLILDDRTGIADLDRAAKKLLKEVADAKSKEERTRLKRRANGKLRKALKLKRKFLDGIAGHLAK